MSMTSGGQVGHSLLSVLTESRFLNQNHNVFLNPTNFWGPLF